MTEGSNGGTMSKFIVGLLSVLVGIVLALGGFTLRMAGELAAHGVMDQTVETRLNRIENKLDRLLERGGN